MFGRPGAGPGAWRKLSRDDRGERERETHELDRAERLAEHDGAEDRGHQR
ncbi:hypothetical protein SVIO_083980 [Streptomyces violaceusniger]|uniref:Uncharacterized protein n=1 Tax=Streptomyces violaceusniger TaxID=68280 RepID=A0A4D4L9J0_STRVO|nr:hypothetical protein SVIO_083980 [Streptomyces violaceusniger]